MSATLRFSTGLRAGASLPTAPEGKWIVGFVNSFVKYCFGIMHSNKVLTRNISLLMITGTVLAIRAHHADHHWVANCGPSTSQMDGPRRPLKSRRTRASPRLRPYYRSNTDIDLIGFQNRLVIHRSGMIVAVILIYARVCIYHCIFIQWFHHVPYVWVWCVSAVCKRRLNVAIFCDCLQLWCHLPWIGIVTNRLYTPI